MSILSGIGRMLTPPKAIRNLISPILSFVPGGQLINGVMSMGDLLQGHFDPMSIMGALSGFKGIKGIGGIGDAFGKLSVDGAIKGLGKMQLEQILPLVGGALTALNKPKGANNVAGLSAQFDAMLKQMMGIANQDLAGADQRANQVYRSNRMAGADTAVGNNRAVTSAGGLAPNQLDTERGVSAGVIRNAANKDIAAFEAGNMMSLPGRQMALSTPAMQALQGGLSLKAAHDYQINQKKTQENQAYMDLLEGLGDLIKPGGGTAKNPGGTPPFNPHPQGQLYDLRPGTGDLYKDPDPIIPDWLKPKTQTIKTAGSSALGY